MRRIAFLLPILLCASAEFASEIREFDVKTLQRLGNELIRVSQTADKGATTLERKRAKQTAIATLRGALFDIHYDYVVLDDPTGNGFLVYALGTTGRPDRVVLAGHARVSVSTDGRTIKRIDRLSHTLMIEDPKHQGVPKDTKLVGSVYNQIVSNRPVETLLYTSNLSRRAIFVQTPDGKMWQVANGKCGLITQSPAATA